MLFKIFQLLESMGITDNLLCFISPKCLKALFFLIFSSDTGLLSFLTNLTCTAINFLSSSVLSTKDDLITYTKPTISIPKLE